MKVTNIMSLPVAANVCEQILREVEKQPNWSMAHVIMDPMASSLLHYHQRTVEIYVITKGTGALVFGDGTVHYVAAGSVFVISLNHSHALINKSVGYLEHLVFALPPFDPEDVFMFDGDNLIQDVYILSLPKPQDAFDGAKIVSYAPAGLDMSIAFGWIVNNPLRRRRFHFHRKITEFAYIVSGRGFVETGQIFQPVQPGDWVCIASGEDHGFVNESPEALVVVCVCFPAFQMEDINYRP